MDKVRLCGTALSVFLSLSCLSSATENPAQASENPAGRLEIWRPIIAAASQRFGIPRSWIQAVILAETGGQLTINGEPITSKAGAMGLMQVMPETYAELRQHYGLGSDPYDPASNIMAGTAYLAELYRQFGFPGLFAAYNAGPQRYADHLMTGDPLPGETISYLKTIDEMGIEPQKMTQGSARNAVPNVASVVPASPLFFIQNGVTSRSIFVPLQSSAESSE